MFGTTVALAYFLMIKDHSASKEMGVGWWRHICFFGKRNSRSTGAGCLLCSALTAPTWSFFFSFLWITWTHFMYNVTQCLKSTCYKQLLSERRAHTRCIRWWWLWHKSTGSVLMHGDPNEKHQAAERRSNHKRGRSQSTPKSLLEFAFKIYYLCVYY